MVILFQHISFCTDTFPTTLLSPLYTLIIPFRIEPYTDGRSWARKPGLEQHRGVRPGEELTDEEDE